MRFTCLLAAFATITSVLGGQFQMRTTKAQPISPRINHLESRALVGVTACVALTAGNPVTLRVALLGGSLADVVIGLDLCVCVANGVLTQTTVDSLRAQVKDRVTINAVLLGGVATINVAQTLSLEPLVKLLGDGLLASITAPPNVCGFKTGAIPDGCGTCTYTCPATAPIKCDKGCRTTACPSGLSVTRRSRDLSSNLLCPKGLTACGLPDQVSSPRARMECLDTQRSVEACGGCEFPLLGQVKGIDCTAIDNTSDVSCVAGKCVIGSCLRGYRLLDGECVLAGLVKQA